MAMFIRYLSGRQQRVFISGVPSTWLPVTSGVPQASILGPLLFLLYINDLPVNVRYSKIALFADDAKCVKNVKSVASCVDLQGDMGGGPRVVVSTAAFHARVQGSVPGLGGLKETKHVSSPSTCESQYCGDPPWPRDSVLCLRPPGLEFRILCFFNQIYYLWNKLPNDVRCITETSRLINNIKKLGFFNFSQNSFNDSTCSSHFQCIYANSKHT